MFKKLGILGCAMLAGLTSNNVNAQENNSLEGKKILVAYYSWGGNTKKIAQKIQEQVGGDIFEIETKIAYPENYKETVAQAKKEINDGFRPEMKTNVENIAQYDVIFVGSPNWWATIAPIVSTFLEANDLSGKTVIPFITHGGGGAQKTVSDITEQCKNCDIKEAYVCYESMGMGLGKWIKSTGDAK